MPVTPLFDWEQSLLDVTVTVTLRGVPKDATDVFISDMFVKVNATAAGGSLAATATPYLLALDLWGPIIVEKSSFRLLRSSELAATTTAAGKSAAGKNSTAEQQQGGGDHLLVKITLPKVTEALWPFLAVTRHNFKQQEKDLQLLQQQTEQQQVEATEVAVPTENAPVPDRKEYLAYIKNRRSGAVTRAEQLYNTRLDSREKQKEVEKKRMQHEQWEVERKQRQEILDRVKAERQAEHDGLAAWDTEQRAATAAATQRAIASPADVAFLASATAASTTGAAAAAAPAIRSTETTNVTINFTPKSLMAPARSRGDEDYYRKSRYKPVSVQDSPMFWKEKADKLYRVRDFRGAADAYTESIKRDGCFLACVSNRAACFIHLHEYKKAIQDCDLALTLLANTPASETTQDQYKRLMCKLHARRGAARCWDEQFGPGLEDLRMAAAYRNSDAEAAGGGDLDVVADLATVEDYMKRQGIAEARDPHAQLISEAGQLYYSGNYAAAVDLYRNLLALDEFQVKARSNLCAALLQQGRHQEALVECEKIIEFCAEVAAALQEPGARSSASGIAGADSDDEDEDEDEMVARKRAAARRIGERSGHVYMLLKAYVRAGAAYCGLKDFRKAFEFYERAVAITPFDDDLRDDANRILETLKFDTLIASTKTASGAAASTVAAAA